MDVVVRHVDDHSHASYYLNFAHFVTDSNRTDSYASPARHGSRLDVETWDLDIVVVQIVVDEVFEDVNVVEVADRWFV